MKYFTWFLSILQLAFFSLSSAPAIQEIFIVTEDSETVYIMVDPTETLEDTLRSIASALSPEGKTSLGVENDGRRDYYRQVTDAEKSDARKILKNLATNSWTDLLDNKSMLKRCGDQIAHIHPLRFLHCIFSDEEFKGYIHAIKDMKIIWKEFFSGLSESLEKEFNLGNIKEEYIKDFTTNTGVPQRQSKHLSPATAVE